MTDQRPTHSPIGASSMHRWKNCPGSIALSAGIPNKAGVAAQEGTAAHELIGLALERAFSSNVPTRVVLDDIIKAVTVYSDYIESIKKDNPVHIEHSFNMNDIFANLYGTADCVIYDKATKTLHVIDYKHGAGIPVDVIDNLQLSYYALGALHTLGYPCLHVQMTIVQPRCYHPGGFIRHWTVSALYFIEFELELIKAAKETKKKKAKLNAGDHCMFCPAKLTCPQIHKQNLSDAKKQFTFYKDPKDEFEPIGNADFEMPDTGLINLFD